jgi:hypothetical protein
MGLNFDSFTHMMRVFQRPDNKLISVSPAKNDGIAFGFGSGALNCLVCGEVAVERPCGDEALELYYGQGQSTKLQTVASTLLFQTISPSWLRTIFQVDSRRRQYR